MKRIAHSLYPTPAIIGTQSLTSQFCADIEARLPAADDMDCIILGRFVNQFTSQYALGFWQRREIERVRQLIVDRRRILDLNRRN